jgi:hypothetical protein
MEKEVNTYRHDKISISTVEENDFLKKQKKEL